MKCKINSIGPQWLWNTIDGGGFRAGRDQPALIQSMRKPHVLSWGWLPYALAQLVILAQKITRTLGHVVFRCSDRPGAIAVEADKHGRDLIAG